MNRKRGWILLVAFACAVGLTLAASAGAQNSNNKSAATVTVSVGADQALNYPSGLLTLPDEHTTFMPPEWGSDNYLVFASSLVTTAGMAGTVVLQTSDLVNFDFAEGYDNPVMSPPVLFGECDPTFDTEFDENYSAPGSVLRDPDHTRDGHLLMFYEAENHCPGGVHQTPFYVTVGFATSRDFGKTWPAPVDAEFGGPERYPVLKVPAPEPTVPEPTPTAWGDAIPSAFIEHNYVYVTYNYWAGPSGDGDPPNDYMIRVARAKLRNHHDESLFDKDHDEPLTFLKWNNGSFSTPGIGGVDSTPLPSAACPGGIEIHSSISRIDPIGLYLMVFVCESYKLVSGVATAYQAGWYYSTASSLELQDWTAPQLITGSQFPVVSPCGAGGTAFDGFYPSLMSPGMQPGHLSLAGQVFFMDGCDLGTTRQFKSRTFTITAQ